MKYRQHPTALLMVRPVSFGFNPETATSNTFQTPSESNQTVSASAQQEFDRMVEILVEHGIDVEVFDDTDGVVKPDAVFPNNWISFHHDGRVILYPMLAVNRRAERRMDIVDAIAKKYRLSEVIDLSVEELEERFLEGTGSIVFDHPNRIMYVCRSPRTNLGLLDQVSNLLSYTTVVFDAVNEQSQPIYHTNVMLSIAEKFAVVCLDSIKSEKDQDLILDNFERTGHKVIAISFAQMKQFAGNIFCVDNKHGESFVLMSQSAFDSLLPGQINEISKFSEILPFNVESIQRYGGGSVRCMVAGIHLPLK